MGILTHFALKLTAGEIGFNSGVGTDNDVLNNTLTLVYTWAGIVAVVIIILGGFLFVTARGDAAQMKRSKDAIRGAVIGLIVIMLAFVITRFVIGGVQG